MKKTTILFCFTFLINLYYHRLNGQCTITMGSPGIDYYSTSCNGLTFQSRISVNNFTNGNCNGFNYSSELTNAPFVTPYMESNLLNSIGVFPNPIDQKFTIQWKEVDLECQVSLYSAIGIKIYSYQRPMRETNTVVYTKNLAPGMYILSISNPQHQYQFSQKLLKL